MVINNMPYNQNLIGSHIHHYNGDMDYRKLICDIGNFQNENI